MVDIDVNVQCKATLGCRSVTFNCVREDGHPNEHHAVSDSDQDINAVLDANDSATLRQWLWFRG
jgi:hypothetical protein